jgi:hypothetical protein
MQQTSQSNPLGGAELYSQFAPPNSWLFRPMILPENRGVQPCTHLLNRQPLPQPYPAKDSGDRGKPQPPDLPIGHRKWPVSPFALAIVPGTTRKHANGPRLPCRDAAQARTWFAPRPSPASTWTPLPELSISSTRPTKGGHRRPSRPLDSFLC